jgi:hypothetical protein
MAKGNPLNPVFLTRPHKMDPAMTDRRVISLASVIFISLYFSGLRFFPKKLRTCLGYFWG